MYILRKKGNLKLNCNLFQLYFEPQFRLIAQIYTHFNSKARREITQLYKFFWKKFVCLPKSTPNSVIKLFAGDSADKMIGLAKINTYKLDCYEREVRIDNFYC